MPHLHYTGDIHCERRRLADEQEHRHVEPKCGCRIAQEDGDVKVHLTRSPTLMSAMCYTLVTLLLAREVEDFSAQCQIAGHLAKFSEALHISIVRVGFIAQAHTLSSLKS